MHAVYRTTVAIPEFGAQPGDLLVVDPSDEVAAVQVVRPIRDRGLLPVVLKYTDQLELIHLDPPVSSQTPAQLLMRAVQP